MAIDWTISFGSLIQLGGMLIGGLAVLITLRNTVTGLKEDVTSIQYELRQMAGILTKMAVAETRLDNADTRIARIEADIRDLRKGVGWVKGHHGVDGEYVD
jgi:hypothetical protein